MSTYKMRLLSRLRAPSIPSSFFVDYIEDELHVHKRYKIISINGKDYSDDLGAVLSIGRIREQTGKALSYTPIGWKTICTIQFTIVPKEVSNLKTAEAWDDNPDAVNLELSEIY